MYFCSGLGNGLLELPTEPSTQVRFHANTYTTDDETELAALAELEKKGYVKKVKTPGA